MRRFAAVLVLLVSSAALANDEAEAKNYFNAGAQAYSVGKFSAAIRAFELAYQLSPLPGILFSLAQAERRQYFVDRDPAHLTRAVDSFHRYVDGEVQGGRRVEAVEALSELEPLLMKVKGGTTRSGEAALVTRMMISCPTTGAKVAVDDKAPVEAPYIEDVAPGQHRIKVTAAGFFDEERTVPVSPGALFALDLPLRERPAELTVKTEVGASVWLDGQEKGLAPLDAPVTMSPGSHRLGILKPGRAVFSERLIVERGDVFTRQVELGISAQRVWAWSMLIVGGATIVAGAVFSGLAVDSENRALQISNRAAGGLSIEDLSNYQHFKAERTAYTVSAVAAMVLGVVLDLISLPMFFRDRPALAEPTTTFRTHPEVAKAPPAEPAAN